MTAVVMFAVAALLAFGIWIAWEQREQNRLAALWRRERAVLAALRTTDARTLGDVIERAHRLADAIDAEGCFVEATQLRMEALRAAKRVRDDRAKFQGWVNERV